jgi:transcriptional regulator with XRE-family HTH domain
MSSRQRLDNYLRMYRKRAGLSQDEVGFLLGGKSGRSGTIASRHEQFRRRPSLETALACEAIYGVPVSELFAGVSERAEDMVRRRARVLSKRLGKGGRRADHLSKSLGGAAPNEATKIAA